ncbi:MAG: hypothetical protein ACYCWW_08810 [Deltaproteobacteria bacterium]
MRRRGVEVPEELEPPGSADLIERVRGALGAVEVVPMAFGKEPSGVDHLASWASGVAARD